jgi:hypothetical protein
MRSRALLLVVAAASGGGCRQLFGIDDTAVARDGGGEDAPPGAADAMIDAPLPPDAAACAGVEYGTGILRICLATPPVGAIAIGNQQVFDTTADPTCQPGQDPAYCVLAYDTFVVALGGRLRLTGSRAFVLVARSITISGRLDGASRSSFNTGGELPGIGPGADSPLCGPSVLPMLVDSSGGGGAGGSFGGRGGAGGDGRTINTGGQPAIAPPPGGVTRLRGGCPGDAGAQGSAAGAGGNGGGAVYLIATESIVVEIGAVINASGAGARGGDRAGGVDYGGGGGGSGGMIGLDAPQIRNDGMVYANGGAGGEGGRNGQDGYNPPNAYTAAPGGFGGGGNNGGEGGDGSVGSELDGGAGGAGAGVEGAGGGGGGGAGVIRVFTTGGIQGSGLVSPPAM